MSYKVLFIDDEPVHLLRILGGWEEQSNAQKDSSSLSYPLQFVGLSVRYRGSNNLAGEDVNRQIHYVDVDNNERWEHLSPLDQDKLSKTMLRRFLEKITEIQPDAILLDIHLGYRAVLRGDMLLQEIRKYYPYMAIIMVSKTPDKVPFNMSEYPSAEYLLNFSGDTSESYTAICERCSCAIDYRGIPKQQYENNQIDHRLPPDISVFIQGLENSLLLGRSKDNIYPIIFLRGNFGSSRRLFALWMNALMQRRDKQECFPSTLTEINCACLSILFNEDQDKKVHLNRLFEPSHGRILYLTDVDKVPESMREVFKETVEGWRKKALIIATATDNERIVYQRLPKGVKKIESYEEWSPLLKKKESTKCLISLLPFSSIKAFIGSLEEAKIKYELVDCNNLPTPKKVTLLLLNNVDKVPDDCLEDFKAAVRRYKEQFRIVVTIADSSDIGLQNLPNNDEIMHIKLPSLQERFKGTGIDSKDISSFLDTAFPTWESITDGIPHKDELKKMHPTIIEYYENRLKEVDTKEINTECQQRIRNHRTAIKEFIPDRKKNVSRTFFFQELCDSIVKRLGPIIVRPAEFPKCDAITTDAEILLAIQMHDWSEVIFNQSRGIYDLEEILKNAVASTNTSEVNASDIGISNSASKAEEIIEAVRASKGTMSQNGELGFEVLTRAYAREYRDYFDDESAWKDGLYATQLKIYYDGRETRQSLPPFEAKPLIQNLRGDYNTIRGLGILNGLKKIVASAKKILDYE